MFPDNRVFDNTDHDFPTTPALQRRLAQSGRAKLPKSIAPSARPSAKSPEITDVATIPIGFTVDGRTVDLDLDRVMAGRLLIQGSSGAGKSKTLRHIIESAFDFLPIFIVDPEGEFGNLAAHIGAVTILAGEVANDGLTAASLRARHLRLPLHLDLSDLDPNMRIQKAAAFFSGLLSTPRDDWKKTVLVAIDEAHLLAPHLAASSRDAETRRLGVATLTELMSRGRKRGIGSIVATQRLAKLASSVVSELQSVLIGLNIYDRDIARARDLLGFSAAEAQQLGGLRPGEFFAFGPALTRRATRITVSETITEHLGATPQLMASASMTAAEARAALEIDRLPQVAHAPEIRQGRGTSLLDAFLLHSEAPVAALIIEALRKISPNATTAEDLVNHLGRSAESIHSALDVLNQIGAIDTMPKNASRIARLSARLRVLAVEPPVVGLS
jgi:hypothetical protein